MTRLPVLLALGAVLALSACHASAPLARPEGAPRTVSPVPPAPGPTDPPLSALRIAARPLPSGPAFDSVEVEAGVRAVLEAQVRAWNEGSVRTFMNGYAEADSLVFLSGSQVRRGWEEALYAYLRAYPDPAAMGLLSFDEVTVEPLSAAHALVWGRWHLRVDGPLDAQPGGLFTLLFVRTDQGWRIVHDHTS
ncbi:MAG TPA: nuclear transport factor 2 family protein [Rubricoccaceae bacterium]